MLLKGMILTCSSHIQAERTISSIYHLLKGRKSIQTVQDAHIYQLEKFYGVYKSLSKKTFDQNVLELENKQFLQKNASDDLQFKITTAGKGWLNEHKDNLPLNYFNGLKYADTAKCFFERLILLIQTITNSRKNHYSFIPVIDKIAIEDWVRMIYRQAKGSEMQLLKKIYAELYRLLQHFTAQEANIFVDRLTGYKQYGMSLEQLATSYKRETSDIQLLLTGILQAMVAIIQKDIKQYSFLSFTLKDLSPSNSITNSAYATFELLNKGHTVEQIAHIRNLKGNTIQDHIVEIALYDATFPIHSYVSAQAQQEIITAIQQTKSYKLKQIKQYISEEINYFQIRLVLAINHNILQAGDTNA
ncbi:uncharacterized protein YpbB [Virgibacillus halotolerans]|uniref:helix-turn-helix domain-containing protein n=1 Tax=Virgibacillus halotolerans TaxID=1071053 RepID=UPI0019607053|nr:helix-turn-helix domain-containing protein [Virgibacillus halotolerans]MBM7598331.1 uncharacterized protein YpbB [Virgibacillus halotolerans]